MNEVYIDIRKENSWIKQYFDTDFVSIDKLLAVIEDLDSEIEVLKEKIEEEKIVLVLPVFIIVIMLVLLTIIIIWLIILIKKRQAQKSRLIV